MNHQHTPWCKKQRRRNCWARLGELVCNLKQQKSTSCFSVIDATEIGDFFSELWQTRHWSVSLYASTYATNSRSSSIQKKYQPAMFVQSSNSAIWPRSWNGYRDKINFRCKLTLSVWVRWWQAQGEARRDRQNFRRVWIPNVKPA